MNKCPQGHTVSYFGRKSRKVSEEDWNHLRFGQILTYLNPLRLPDEPLRSWSLALRIAQSRLLSCFSDECEVFNFDKGVV